MGIEPIQSTWKEDILPLNQSRLVKKTGVEPVPHGPRPCMQPLTPHPDGTPSRI